MKKLLFTLPILFSINAYADNKIDTVKQIVSLAESGEIFNLSKTAEKLNLKDEIYRAEHKPVAYGNRITYTYPIHTHQVIQSLSYRVSFGGRDLSEVHKSVDITFKSEYCPSGDDLQKTFGEKLMVSEMMGSPSLQTTEQGVRYPSVRYTEYHILGKNNLVFIKNNGCEFSVLGRAKFE